MGWLKHLFNTWASENMGALFSMMQSQVSAVVLRQSILEGDVATLKRRISSDLNLRTDIANFEQRLDALCKVCGVEVVITQGEVVTKEISPASVARSEEAAALYELTKEISNAYTLISRAQVKLARAQRSPT